MKADGSAPLTFIRNRTAVRAASVGLAALLLASCSTSSDPFAGLGLVAQSANPQPSATEAAETAEVGDTGNYFIVSKDDPDLPEEVAYQPSLANGEEPLAVASGTIDQAAPAEASAAVTPRVDDPVLAARMGADGVYLETAPERQQAAAPAVAPEPPKRRNFFASLFAAPESESPETQRPVPEGQPQLEQAAAAEPESDAASGTQATDTELAAVATTDGEPAGEVQSSQPTAFLENRPAEANAQAAPKKRGFLSSFFSGSEPRTQQRETRPLVKVAATAPPAAASATDLYGRDALPGVRDTDSLYEIKRKSGTDDHSDIDINEGDGYQVAMAPGLARLAPNGLLVQTDKVDVACLKPSLVRVLKSVERHYGERVVVTSGYRSPPHNARARGARNSLHMYCAAADIQVAGVDKWELAAYLRSMPGRGGVGTYCHTKSVHVDVGPERDWNWRCRRRRK